jgi:hypothetical protein
MHHEAMPKRTPISTVQQVGPLPVLHNFGCNPGKARVAGLTQGTPLDQAGVKASAGSQARKSAAVVAVVVSRV